MIKFRNKVTGTDMFADEARVEEYLQAGHELACGAPAAPQAEPKKASKKRTKKEA